MTGEEQQERAAEGRGPLHTVTHARLRAAQGDYDGARRILEALLRRRPGDSAALGLLRSLGGFSSGSGTPGASGTSAVARLQAWLRVVSGPDEEAADAGEGSMLDRVLDQVRERVPGARCVMLLGLDGVIVLASPRSAAGAWEWAAAGYAELLRRAGDANREAALAVPDELVLTGEDVHLALRRVDEQYGLLAVLDPRSRDLGQTRFELRKAAGRIGPELRS